MKDDTEIIQINVSDTWQIGRACSFPHPAIVQHELAKCSAKDVISEVY
jgi:hypothetical protein